MRFFVLGLGLVLGAGTAFGQAAESDPPQPDATAEPQGSPSAPEPEREPEPTPEPAPTPEPERESEPTPTEAAAPAPARAPAPVAADTPTVSEITEAPAPSREGFSFGSYGRINVGSDLRGATPEAINVVAHGSRVVEDTYLELDLYYRLKARRGVELTTVTTLAFGDQLFHLTGEFDATVALRNFYLQADKGPLTLWAGSRMYRGDDIYLFDYWPLDDTNTVGGGAGYQRDRLGVAGHVGLNRLIDPFFFQERNVLAPGGIGAETIPQLDRQRYIASAQSTYRIYGPKTGGPAAKAKVYVEIQGVGSGTRELEADPDSTEELPSDFGYTIGGQLGGWGFGPGATHVNLFARYSRGLAAFDELNPPMAVDETRKSTDASEFLVAVSGNYEIENNRAGIMAAAYSRRFIDGDPNVMDRDDGWEYIVDIRPRVRVVDDVETALDLSYQARFPKGVSPTELTALDPGVFAIAPMVMYSPFGTGSYARPQFRLVYRAAHLNEGARDLYPLDDPRRFKDWVHYLGLQAEWWFNSTYR